MEKSDLRALAAEFDAAGEDASWEEGHPIFRMAEDNDRLRARVAVLEAERDEALAQAALDREHLEWLCSDLGERLEKEMAEQERDEARAANAELRAALGDVAEFLRTRYSRHEVCEDSWYSCPKSPDCSNANWDNTPMDERPCCCGYDHARAVLARLSALLEKPCPTTVNTNPDTSALMTKPLVVCLCGSTRFKDEFARLNYDLTIACRIVLSIGCDTKSDEALGISPEIKERLDWLHRRKIDLADEILVINKDGYVGDSTLNEIAYAVGTNKPVRLLEGSANEFLEAHSHELGLRLSHLMPEVMACLADKR